MTDLLSNLALGFSVAVTGTNLAFCLLGALVGTLVGVLPGLGPITTIALLMPFTFYLEPTTALIMLAGIFYGAQYGGSTTSILMNIPGEASSVVTCLDGHPMARQGRAGTALAIAAWGSFIAGSIAVLVLAGGAAWLSSIARTITSVEYFSIMVLGLVAAVVLASGSVINALAMIALGLLIGLVGTDVNTGTQRFVFGIPLLADGLDFVALATGLFGIAEVISSLGRRHEKPREIVGKVSSLMLSKEDWKRSAPAIGRATVLGSILGALPGSGGMISSFASYALERHVAKDRSRFGKGAIEGVAGPESANNAGAQTSFIPLLTLGIPSNATMAVLSGAMIIHGIQPGPNVINEQPSLFWGLICSMWVGNVMLLVINLPLIRIWAKVMDVPYKYTAVAIVLLCSIGVYAVLNSFTALLIVAAFGVFGWLMRLLNCEPAPLVLGFVLGPLMEENFRRAMLIANGDASVFISRPASAIILAIAAGLFLLLLLPAIRRRREKLTED